MKFDSNRAWQEATSAVSANRDVLIALAGVFFLLPSLAFGLFYPQPEPVPGMDEKAVLSLMSDYYASAAPVLIPMFLIQAAGTLAMLTLFTDRARPTVREAIGLGAGGIAAYLLAQLLLGVGAGVMGGLLLAIGAATGQPMILALFVAVVGVAAIYAFIRTSLVAPIIAVEHVRNPVAALRRSWHLTQGNTGRLGLFFALVLVAFVIVGSLIMAVIGIILALVAGAEAARVAAAIVSSIFTAAMTIYMVAILAAAHRQLAGPSPEAIGQTFD
jgi:hypothetical protein